MVIMESFMFIAHFIYFNVLVFYYSESLVPLSDFQLKKWNMNKHFLSSFSLNITSYHDNQLIKDFICTFSPKSLLYCKKEYSYSRRLDGGS